MRLSGNNRRWTQLALLTLFVLAAIGLGRSFGHHIPALDRWIAANGLAGVLVFIGAVVLFTSVFVPDTVFAVIAGTLFGLGWGTLVVCLASLGTATVDFFLARWFLRERVRRWLAHRPRLAAIEQAVNREGLRFQFLLRLTPLNPVTVSYVLGASDARFGPFLTACLGLIPGLAVEVYFGYVARHVAKLAGNVGHPAPGHSALIIAGLGICVGMLIYLTRLAHRALASYSPLAVR